jgi:hypothetical protein
MRVGSGLVESFAILQKTKGVRQKENSRRKASSRVQGSLR